MDSVQTLKDRAVPKGIPPTIDDWDHARQLDGGDLWDPIQVCTSGRSRGGFGDADDAVRVLVCTPNLLGCISTISVVN
jgi:hypothetical protein